jgi:hypothetical protein
MNLSLRDRDRLHQCEHGLADEIFREMPISFHPEKDEPPDGGEMAVVQIPYGRRVLPTKSLDERVVVQADASV